MKKENKEQTIHLRIDDEMNNDLNEIQKKTGFNISFIVRTLLTEYTNEYKLHKQHPNV